MMMTNGLIIERSTNGKYIVKTQDFAIHEVFNNRVEMMLYVLTVFKEIDCEFSECKLCADTGWVLHGVYQDKVRADMHVFVSKLYVECECKKIKKVA